MASDPTPETTTDDPYRENDRFVIRRILIPVTVLFVLLGSFYGIENWRGQRAWDKAVAELAAKGGTLDWRKFVPEPVPDEENMLKAPHMEDWFVHGNAPFRDDSFLKPLLDAIKQQTAKGPIPIGTLKLVPPEEAKGLPHAFELAKLSGQQEQVELAMLNQLGYDGRGWRGLRHQLTSCSLPETPSVSLALAIATSAVEGTPPKLTTAEEESLFRYFQGLRVYRGEGDPSPYIYDLKKTGDPSAYTILVKDLTSLNIRDFIRTTDQFAGSFDALVEAAKRPGVYLSKSYSHAGSAPELRHEILSRLVDMAFVRFDYHLLMSNPEASKDFAALSAVRKMSRMNRGSLDGTQHHLNWSGVHLDAVFQGLKAQAWSADQLERIAREEEDEYLPRFAADNLQALRARVISSSDITTATVAELCRSRMKKGWPNWAEKADQFLWKFAPLGWKKQNMANYASGMQVLIEDLVPEPPSPPPLASYQLLQQLREDRLHERMAARILPSSQRVVWETLRVQTQAHLVIIGCALERHRLATGSFPETLAMLSPGLVAKMPAQEVNGEPYLYRREADGGYSLWSVGWNRKDDGGVFPTGGSYRRNISDDWGWRMPGPAEKRPTK